MTWHRSTLPTICHALHYGHSGRIPAYVITMSTLPGMLNVGSDGRMIVVAVAELATWCALLKIPAPSEADVGWLLGPPPR